MIAWVYIVTNKPHGVVYVGVTSDLKGRIAKHKAIAARSLWLRAPSRIGVALLIRKRSVEDRHDLWIV